MDRDARIARLKELLQGYQGMWPSEVAAALVDAGVIFADELEQVGWRHFGGSLRSMGSPMAGAGNANYVPVFTLGER